jgi:hypothetical protein
VKPDISMIVLYLAHGVHAGERLNYNHAGAVDEALFDSLPFTYGISYVRAEGVRREVIASIVVKTDAGQSHQEVGQIFREVAGRIPELNRLPKQGVILRCTKLSLSPGVPAEEDLLEILTGIYTVNGIGGQA